MLTEKKVRPWIAFRQNPIKNIDHVGCKFVLEQARRARFAIVLDTNYQLISTADSFAQSIEYLLLCRTSDPWIKSESHPTTVGRRCRSIAGRTEGTQQRVLT